MLYYGAQKVSKLDRDKRDSISYSWQLRLISEIDFFLMLITLLFCVFLKLEWGIIIGISLNLAILLYFSARPSVQTEIEQVN